MTDAERLAEVRAAWLRARVGETDAWTLLDELLGVHAEEIEAEREAAVQA